MGNHHKSIEQHKGEEPLCKDQTSFFDFKVKTIDGSPLGKQIEVELHEMNSQSSMLLQNAPTVSNGETFCEIEKNVRGADVFVVQSTSSPVNDNLMALLTSA